MTATTSASPATITELVPTTRISLRTGEPGTTATGLGLDLPRTIGARSGDGALAALCLGPDEWLLEAPASEANRLTTTLAALEGRVPLSAVDVSDREITFALSGAAVLDLLATGCPRDVARMAVGSGCRTVFDTVQIVLTREAQDRFHLTVWRSFAPHLRSLLDLAAREIAVGL